MSVLIDDKDEVSISFTGIIQLQDAYFLHHFISSQMEMVVKGQGH